MLISHRYRFIYTKTAKTAGTSVEAYFEPYCMHDGEWLPSHAREVYESSAGIVGFRGGNRDPKCSWWNHMSAREVHAQIGDEMWSSYFKFCVVRNPFDRLVSQFYFANRDIAASRFDGRHSERFVHWLTTVEVHDNSAWYKIDDRVCLDFMIRFERLEEDMRAVCLHLGLEWNPLAMPAYKSGIRPAVATTTRMYTESARQLVQEKFAVELRELGYTFPQA